MVRDRPGHATQTLRFLQLLILDLQQLELLGHPLFFADVPTNINKMGDVPTTVSHRRHALSIGDQSTIFVPTDQFVVPRISTQNGRPNILIKSQIMNA